MDIFQTPSGYLGGASQSWFREIPAIRIKNNSFFEKQSNPKKNVVNKFILVGV